MYIEGMLRRAKYAELNQDYKKIDNMLRITETMISTQIQFQVKIDLIKHLGDIVCSLWYHSSQSDEIGEVKNLKNYVSRQMELIPHKEWHREWQNLSNRLEDIH